EKARLVALGLAVEEDHYPSGASHHGVGLLYFLLCRALTLHFDIDADVGKPEVRQVVAVIHPNKIRLVEVEDVSGLKHARPKQLCVGAEAVALMVVNLSALSHQKFTFTTLSSRVWLASGMKRDRFP